MAAIEKLHPKAVDVIQTNKSRQQPSRTPNAALPVRRRFARFASFRSAAASVPGERGQHGAATISSKYSNSGQSHIQVTQFIKSKMFHPISFEASNAPEFQALLAGLAEWRKSVSSFSNHGILFMFMWSLLLSLSLVCWCHSAHLSKCVLAVVGYLIPNEVY